MKSNSILALALALTASALCAQSVTTTTTKEVTANGVISTFEPQSFVIKSETGAAPMTYSYGASTQYVDEAGNVVSREVIKPGAPVTVQYVREGDRLLANRVIVHHTTTTTDPGRPLTEKEAKALKEAREHPEREARRAAEKGKPFPPADPSRATTTTTTTTTEGTISSAAPGQIILNSAEGGPVTYRYSKSTEYVDDTGAPVSVEVVKSGAPVTVTYVREGDGLVAQRVVVHTHRR
jgi:hypothetical protein